ncbi:uncharacterized protein [Coffea arabica]|uniref:Uncharacterized protein n=1 Tax=Coffea arabica TaxID=13443 RepID=A0ABM4WNQ4_COFAR
MSLLKVKLKLLILLLRKRKPESREKNSGHCSKGKGWSKTKSFLSKHIGSVFSEALGNESQEMLSISQEQEGKHDRIDRSTTKEHSEGQGIAPNDQEVHGRRGEVFGERSLQQSVNAGNSFSGSFATNVNLSGEQERSKQLARIPSRRCSSHKKRRHAKLKLKKGIQQGKESEEEDEESGGIELCKKKILMGRKCRPLNKSGTLQYDENGILLPEVP